MQGARRGRKRRGAEAEAEAEADQEHTQDPPYTPPLRSRRSKRSSTSLRVLGEDRLVPNPKLPTGDDPVSENLLEAVKRLKASTSSAPIIKHDTDMDGLDDDHFQPPRETAVVEAVKRLEATTSPAPLIQHNTDMDGLDDDHFQPPREMAVVPIQEKCKTHDSQLSNGDGCSAYPVSENLLEAVKSEASTSLAPLIQHDTYMDGLDDDHFQPPRETAVVEAVKRLEATTSPAPLTQHNTDMDGLDDDHFQPPKEMAVVPIQEKCKTHDSQLSKGDGCGAYPVSDNLLEAVKPEASTCPAPLIQHDTDMDGLDDNYFQPPWEMAVVPIQENCKTHDSELSKGDGCGADPTSENLLEAVKHLKASTSTAPLVQHHTDTDGLDDDHFQPPRETPVAHIQEKCKTYDGPSSNRCPSPSRSLNLTEFATWLEDDGYEVESASRVHGHKVKPEIAPLVGAIFDKYGDITAESNFKSSSIIVSLFLERVCDVYLRLENRKVKYIPPTEINEMLDELHHYQDQKFNVGWLLEKVEQISELYGSAEKYLLYKGEATKCIEANGKIEEEIDMNRRHIGLILKKISGAEKEKEANKAKAEDYTKMALEIAVRVKALKAQSRVHDLL